MADDSDQSTGRRGGERVEILGDLRGEVMVFQPMSIREMSRTGAQIETTFPLLLDSLHDIRVELGTASVVLKGRIVHSSIAEVDRDVLTYRSGIEFVEPNEAVRGVIQGFIDALQAARRNRAG